MRKMKKALVVMTIERGAFTKHEKIEVHYHRGQKSSAIKKIAELIWLNAYINRDAIINEFSDPSIAKRVAGVKITSEIKCNYDK